MELLANSLYSDANLVSYYRLEANSADTKAAFDANNYNVSFSVGNGKYGIGAGLNGATAYINVIAGTSAFRYGTVQPFSVNYWLNPDTTSQVAAVFAKYNSGVNGLFYTDYQSGGILGFFREFPPTYPKLVTGTIAAAGSWIFVSNVYDGTNLNLYVNGTSAVAPAASGTVNNAGTLSPVNIGAGFSSGVPAYFFKGKIDDVSIFSRALTAGEKLALYQDPFGGLDLTSKSW